MDFCRPVPLTEPQKPAVRPLADGEELKNRPLRFLSRRGCEV